MEKAPGTEADDVVVDLGRKTRGVREIEKTPL